MDTAIRSVPIDYGVCRDLSMLLQTFLFGVDFGNAPFISTATYNLIRQCHSQACHCVMPVTL